MQDVSTKKLSKPYHDLRVADSSSERDQTEALVPELFYFKNGMCDVEDEFFCHISFLLQWDLLEIRKTF